MRSDELNEIDQQIVNLLAENARISFSEIGKRVGLSRVAVKNRITALEKSGIIKGYHAEIDRLASPTAVFFCASLTVRTSEKFGEILNEVKSISSVRYIYRLSGGNSILAFGTTDSERHLQNLSWRFQNRKEIEFISVKEIWSVEKGPAGEDGHLPYGPSDSNYENRGNEQ